MSLEARSKARKKPHLAEAKKKKKKKSFSWVKKHVLHIGPMMIWSDKRNFEVGFTDKILSRYKTYPVAHVLY